MKEEIKELRVKIDGLAQLVKGLTGPVVAINVSAIPENIDIDTFIQKWKENSNFMVPMNPIESAVESIHNYELNKTYDSLILAKAWLGKVLGELGESTPYANDGQRKTVEDIEPIADTHRGIKHLEEKGNWNTDYNHIQKVDCLREEIEKSSKEFTVIHLKLPVEVPNPLCVNNFFTHMSEARFWLGFELQRIRENESK